MKNFKKLDKLLARWKAVQGNEYHSWTHYTPKSIDVFVADLETAIAFAKEPSNKVVEDGQAKCKVKSICNVFRNGNCTGIPCPGYAPAT